MAVRGAVGSITIRGSQRRTTGRDARAAGSPENRSRRGRRARGRRGQGRVPAPGRTRCDSRPARAGTAWEEASSRGGRRRRRLVRTPTRSRITRKKRSAPVWRRAGAATATPRRARAAPAHSQLPACAARRTAPPPSMARSRRSQPSKRTRRSSSRPGARGRRSVSTTDSPKPAKAWRVSARSAWGSRSGARRFKFCIKRRRRRGESRQQRRATARPTRRASPSGRTAASEAPPP